MGKRFGRNRKRKLMNEINSLKGELGSYKNVSGFERQSDIMRIPRAYMSYNDLLLKHGSIKPTITVDTFEHIRFRSEIRDNINSRVLLVGIDVQREQFRYFIDIDYLKDLFKHGYPLDAFYKELYDQFKDQVEKALRDL